MIKPTPLAPQSTHNPPAKLATITFADGDDVRGVLDAAEAKYPFLLVPGSKFVAKPDQLIKRRGKSGLLKLNATWPEAKEWIEARANKVQKVEHVEGALRNFLVEPFVPHPQETEYYININSVREVCLDAPIATVKARTDCSISRATGFFSTMKVVWMLVTLTQRRRSS